MTVKTTLLKNPLIGSLKNVEVNKVYYELVFFFKVWFYIDYFFYINNLINSNTTQQIVKIVKTNEPF